MDLQAAAEEVEPHQTVHQQVEHHRTLRVDQAAELVAFALVVVLVG